MKDKILELLKVKKYNDLYAILESMNSQDIAILLEDLEKEDMVLVYRLLPKDKAVETFSYMENDVQEKLIHYLKDKELSEVVNELYMDDVVDLTEEMPANIVKRILKNIKPEQRRVINDLLKYPKNTAGSIMTTEFIDIKENMTVEECFDRIRKIAIDSETIYTCYVLTATRKLVGVITVKELLLADKNICVKDLMNTNIIKVNTLEDQEEVAKKFDKYDLLALPVVDSENCLVGIVTFDDAIDVMQEENTEDFEKMAAINPSEDSYFKTSVFKHAKNRIIWLLVLMLSSIITGTIITKYENAFAAVPILVAFIPMLMDTGGNCGSQSSTLIIRGLAIDEIKLKDFWKAIWKEFRISILIGIVLAIINGIRIVLQYHNILLAIVVGLTLIITVMISKLLGCILPMLAKKLKLDPAIMAAPLITTIVDTCSVLVFFNIAVLLMGI